MGGRQERRRTSRAAVEENASGGAVSTDIELDIGRHGERGHYQVRVVRSPAGGDQREEFDLDIDALLRSRPQLEASILSSSVGARRVMSTAERPVLEAGTHLFESVFKQSVYGAYRASLGVAQQQGERLRVVLRLSEPELAALPWEALFDPERQSYVCRQEPMVRRIPAQFNPRAPLQVTPPLQVLAIVASPRGLVPLDVELERANLEEALAELIAAGLVSITWVEPATWHSVHRHLLSGHWHVVHFIGHGDYDDDRQEGVLAFVGSDGRADMVEAGRFADLLGEADPTPRLVVLNACSSGESGGDDMLSATAPALVHSGIEAVAAMQFAVSDDAAIAFAQGFYTAVAHSRGVDEAARSGRIAILGAAGSLEWLTPVLYLRGDSTHPLVVTPRPDDSTGEEPEPAAARQKARQRQEARQREEARQRREAEQRREDRERRAPQVEPPAETAVLPVPPGLAAPDGPDGPGGPGGPGVETALRRPPRDKPTARPAEPPARDPQPPLRTRWHGLPLWTLLGACVVVVLVAAFLVLRPGGGDGSTGPRLGSRVALVPVRDPSGVFVRVMTYDTGTDALRSWAGAADQLEGGSTSANEDRFSATPSPDRTRVAFLQGAHDRLPMLYVADADGTGVHPLMTSPHRPCRHVKRPAWSPDSLQMAVTCVFADRSWSLWLVDARDGAGIRRLVRRQHGFELGAPTWDAARHTVYTWKGPLPERATVPGTVGRPLSVADDSEDPTPQLVAGVSDDRYTEPDWAAPGILMVHRLKDRDNEVVVVRAGQVTRVAEGSYANATWSPDGQRILATRVEGPKRQQLVVLERSKDGWAPQDTGVFGRFGAPNWGTR